VRYRSSSRAETRPGRAGPTQGSPAESGGKDHQLVRAISRGTTTPHGPRWFNVKYCPHCKIYTAQDVTYAPDLTLPAVKLSELTRGGGSMPAECHVGPPEAIKRDWGRRQTSLL
jgi:hypothetical protein